jgi:hypothetical protein
MQKSRERFEGESPMTVERYLRGIARFFVFVSVLIAHYYSPYWLFFTGFVGLNLLQSAFTNWCPMMSILKKFDVGKQCQRNEV